MTMNVPNGNSLHIAVVDNTFGLLSTWRFVQGLLLGQISVVLLVVACCRYLLFKNGETTPVERLKKDDKRASWSTFLMQRGERKGKEIASGEQFTTRPSLALSTSDSHVLENTFYSLYQTAPESCDWLNVIMGQVLNKFRADACLDNKLSRAIEAIINADTGSRPSFIGPIILTELSLGTGYPLLSRARIRPTGEGTSLRAEIQFDFDNEIAIGFETELLINWPRPSVVTLPISLVLSLERFAGTFSLEIMSGPEPYLKVSILQGYTMKLGVRSLIGHRTKVKDIPKITSLIDSRLRRAFEEKFVSPNYKEIALPNPWNTPPLFEGAAFPGNTASDANISAYTSTGFDSKSGHASHRHTTECFEGEFNTHRTRNDIIRDTIGAAMGDEHFGISEHHMHQPHLDSGAHPYHHSPTTDYHEVQEDREQLDWQRHLLFEWQRKHEFEFHQQQQQQQLQQQLSQNVLEEAGHRHLQERHDDTYSRITQRKTSMPTVEKHSIKSARLQRQSSHPSEECDTSAIEPPTIPKISIGKYMVAQEIDDGNQLDCAPTPTNSSVRAPFSPMAISPSLSRSQAHFRSLGMQMGIGISGMQLDANRETEEELGGDRKKHDE